MPSYNTCRHNRTIKILWIMEIRNITTLVIPDGFCEAELESSEATFTKIASIRIHAEYRRDDFTKSWAPSTLELVASSRRRCDWEMITILNQIQNPKTSSINLPLRRVFVNRLMKTLVLHLEDCRRSNPRQIGHYRRVKHWPNDLPNKLKNYGRIFSKGGRQLVG